MWYIAWNSKTLGQSILHKDAPISGISSPLYNWIPEVAPLADRLMRAKRFRTRRDAEREIVRLESMKCGVFGEKEGGGPDAEAVYLEA